MKKLYLFSFFTLFFCLTASAETVTLSTYYPAPFGAYDRLRLVPRANIADVCSLALEGTMYYSETDHMLIICQEDGLGNFSWGPITGVWTFDPATDSIFPSNTLSNPNLKVGISTTTPQSALQIGTAVEIRDTDNSNAEHDIQFNSSGSLAAGRSLYLVIDSEDAAGSDALMIGRSAPSNNPADGYVEIMRVTDTGNVGIGTVAPESLLHLSATNPMLYLKGSSGADYSSTIRLAGENADNWQGGYIQYDGNNEWFVLGVHDMANKLTANDTRVIAIDRTTGNVGIAMQPHATYKLDVNGTIHATGADLAEHIPVDEDVEPGDVVVISETDDRKLKKSVRPYDVHIAGVISTDPGFMLGQSVDGSQPLALTGQVPCKVTTENGPIKRGDLLASSSKPGYAMKATFIDFEDVSTLDELKTAMDENQKRQMAVIGKALEELAEGDGTIVILIAR